MLRLLATHERQGIYCEVVLMLFSWNFILRLIKCNPLDLIVQNY